MTETALARAEQDVGHPLDGKGYLEYHDRYALALDREPNGASLAAMCAAFGVNENTIWHWRKTRGRFNQAYKSSLQRRYKYNMSRHSEVLARVTEEGDRRMAYRPEMLGILQRYIEDCPDVAMTKHSIANALGVSGSTVDRWRALEPDGVADEIVRGAGDTFLEFWCLVRQLPDYILARAFNQSAVGQMRDRVVTMLAQHHGGYADKTEQDINQRVVFATVDCHDLVDDEQWQRKKG